MPASTRRSAGALALASATTATTSSSVKMEYATPARTIEDPTSVGGGNTRSERCLTTNATEADAGTSIIKTVTPADASTAGAGSARDNESLVNSKQVRFGGKGDGDGSDSREGSPTEEAGTLHDSTSPTNTSNTVEANGNTKSKRGLVSRRGRYVSPGRRVSSTMLSSNKNDSTETTMTSTADVVEYKTFRSPSRTLEHGDEIPSLCSSNSHCESGIMKEAPTTTAAAAPATRKGIVLSGNDDNPGVPTRSISADPSVTSPHPPNGDKNTTTLCATAKNSVSFSPRPAHGGNEMNVSAPKSPGKVATLPALGQEGRGRSSPGALFLAQTTPKRKSAPSKRSSAYYAEEKKSSRDDKDRKLSPKRDRDREHYVATPTDFAVDYGKGHPVISNFDNSNVLAWLHSPTANGLFSPGGYGSLMNTPHAGAGAAGAPPASVPWTPRTPTVSTSFFFSDAANLPRGDHLTPGKRSTQKQGLSNIICISPLASSAGRHGAATPMNLKDVFNSPREKNIGGMPTLNDSPTKANPPRFHNRSGSKDPSLDAVHMAEREVMEDEDLTVLLQLASNTTPRAGSATAAGPVFRSGKKESAKEGGKLPGLQLPMIGGKAGERGITSASIQQKSQTKKADSGDFLPPQLGMRSSSSGGPKEIYVGGKRKDGSHGKNTKATLKAKDPDKAPSATMKSMLSKNESCSNPYSMPLHHHGQDLPSYYGMSGGLPPGIPPGTGGSMRVVVGGPPPPRSGKSGSPMPPMGVGSPHGPPPLYHDYPYPPPGMYTQYPGPPPMGYSYQSHYPPPMHMPMYGAQHPPGPPSPPAKKGDKLPKAGAKRSSPHVDNKPGSPSKKVRKSPGHSKKKNRSPQITDKVERQKSAQKIQAVNEASGGKNDKAAALAAAILRGVTMRPSGKWQAQLYFAGKSRYIGVFDTREKAALAYEIAREKLKCGPKDGDLKSTENLVNLARKAAFEGVNEKAPKSPK